MAVCSDFTDSVEGIISAEMNKNGINPSDVPNDFWIDITKIKEVDKSKRYFRCWGFASFDKHKSPTKSNCKRTWKSQRAWCVLDLKEQCIAHRLYQECQNCNEESFPWFDAAAIKRMAEYAVKRYLISVGKRKRDKRDTDDKNPQFGPPHIEAKCEVCKQLGHSCLKKPQSNARADQEENIESDTYDDEDGYYDDDQYFDEDDEVQYYSDHEDGDQYSDEGDEYRYDYEDENDDDYQFDRDYDDDYYDDDD